MHINDTKDLGHHVLNKSFWIYFFTICILPLQYIVRVYMSGQLSVEDVGLIFATLGMINIIATYNDLGLRESLGFFLPKFLVHKEYDRFITTIWSTIGLQLISAIIFAGLLYIAEGRLVAHYFQTPKVLPLLNISIVYLLCVNIYSIVDGLFMIFHDSFWNKFLELIKYSWMAVSVYCISILYPSNEVLYYYSIYTIGVVGAMIVGIYILLHKYIHILSIGKRSRHWGEYLQVQKYGLGILINNNLMYLMSMGDQIWVQYMMGLKASGRYTNGMMIVNAISSILGTIGILIYPLISHLYASNQHSQIKTLMDNLMTYMGILAIIGGTFVLARAPDIIYLLFGDKYIQSTQIIYWTAPFLLCNIFVGLFLQYFAGSGRIRDRIKYIFMAIFVLVIMMYLTYIYDMNIGGVGLSLGITWLFLMIIFRKTSGLDIQLDYKLYIYNIIIIGIYITIAKYLSSIYGRGYGHYTNRYDTLIYIATTSIIYICIIIGLNIDTVKYIYNISQKSQKDIQKI